MVINEKWFVPASERGGHIDERSLFVFDKDASLRLAMVRMRLGLTQGELAANMGIKQQSLSKVEAGQVTHTDGLTVWALKVALGKYWRFVIFGAGGELLDEKTIRINYWRDQLAKHKRGKKYGEDK